LKELKQHQPAMSIEEQINNLRSIGLIINDVDYAKRVLNDVSYFRLIKAYSLTLKPRNGKYNEGTTFEQIVQLYLFNAKFRQLLFPEIEKVEINVRCRIANYFGDKYGILGYNDKTNFVNEDYFNTFISEINKEIKRNSKAPFVKNFKTNYEGGLLPIYALMEVLSFGTLSKFYKNMKNPDKKAIAKSFGVTYNYFESWLEHLSHVRNVCAHYGRLYNARMRKTPILYKEYSHSGIKNNRVFASLLCLKELLKNEGGWTDFLHDLSNLFDEYDVVDIHTMGFPDNWKNILQIDKASVFSRIENKTE